MFFIAVSALVILALLFCWPLWRSARGTQPEIGRDQREAFNAALYQDFVAELQDDLTLDDATRDGLAADKARQLLDDSPGKDSPGKDSRGKESQGGATSGASGAGTKLGWAVRLAAAGILVLGSAATYWSIGTPMADRLAGARNVLTLPSLGEVEGNDRDASIVELRAHTASLRARVQRTADDAGSWYLLGIGELKLQSYAASADAFEAAHSLVGADTNLDLYWLQARLLADQGKLSAATQTIAKRVLGSQPNQPMVLNMLALAAYRSSDYASAVGYLNSALSNNLTESQREMLASGFDQARQSLGVAGPTVDVALSVTGSPPSDAVLFVIARPVGGGMPYAVVRRPLNGVPASVRLDDAVSMNPANPLSAAAQVEIVARLSLSGRPQAGPGDWQWQSEPLSLAETSTPIVLQAELTDPRGDTGSSTSGR